MRRRDFIFLGAASTAALIAPRLWAQTVTPSNRAAVVIGVNRAGTLPLLSAAVTGAKSVATWLMGEGFDVKLLIDETAPVKANDIFEAVYAFIRKGTIQQLLIYFSGHGFLSHYSEIWMLSGAPTNPNEAISLAESTYLAKQCGIPHVIFISDACRSTPESLGVSQVNGGFMFPTSGGSLEAGSVDRFWATLPGLPALEVPLPQSVGRFHGIFTTCFLDAYKRPYPQMVLTLSDGTRVIPNRRLKGFLIREVQAMAQAASIALIQTPDVDIVCEDGAYIGKVLPATTAANPSNTPREATVIDVAKVALREAGGDTISGSILRPAFPSPDDPPSPFEIRRVAENVGFVASQSAVLNAARGPRSFETQTGFTVSGIPVVMAAANPSRTERPIEILSSGSWIAGPGLVRVTLAPEHRACSVVLQFASGDGIAVPALRGFIGHISVDSTGANNVSYIPAADSPRWPEYSSQLGKLNQLHAAVATSAKYGVLRFDGDAEARREQAREFADRIRVLKSIDPTLGLYAAYAYADADFADGVLSVRTFMEQDLGVSFFDLASLARTRRNTSSFREVVPFCPMLAQGWSLLRVKSIELPPPVQAAGQHLKPALWTTFQPRGTDVLMAAVLEGRLT